MPPSVPSATIFGVYTWVKPSFFRNSPKPWAKAACILNIALVFKCLKVITLLFKRVSILTSSSSLLISTGKSSVTFEIIFNVCANNSHSLVSAFLSLTTPTSSTTHSSFKSLMSIVFVSMTHWTKPYLSRRIIKAIFPIFLILCIQPCTLTVSPIR